MTFLNDVTNIYINKILNINLILSEKLFKNSLIKYFF